MRRESGRTFGSFSYPDATTTSKGIVQIDAVGGIAVNAGVISLANSGVTPGIHTKVTVDAKGRVTAGAALGAPNQHGWERTPVCATSNRRNRP